MFCSQCGNEIPEDSNFCPACGAVLARDRFTPVNNFTPTNNIYVTQSAVFRSEKRPTYVFVVSLIFMILVGIKLYGTLSAVSEYEKLANALNGATISARQKAATNGMFNNVFLNVVSVTLAAIALLILFIQTNAANKTTVTLSQKGKNAKKMIVYSGISLFCMILYVVSEFMLLSSFEGVLTAFNVTSQEAWDSISSANAAFPVVLDFIYIIFIASLIAASAVFSKRVKEAKDKEEKKNG